MAARQPLIPSSAVPWLATGGAIAALCIAWIAQYGFGLAPCALCYWQRYGYWAAIALGIVAILQPARTARRGVVLWLLALAFLVTAGIALFHVGVEQKWWQGLSTCTGGTTAGMSPEEVEQAIMNAPIVRCDEPAWTMFGISMAGYNLVYALALMVFTAWGALRSKAA
ncbi:MAG TPA: disulfide bond formation protein B [Dongiaceae bacterium]|jgi:disulfide bond formation protein DsbB|nr:disulfide bond formation protein B [Dongiaceae bacterium]